MIGFRKPVLNATDRRLAAALTIEDLRLIAKRKTPRAAFDYTDGAAEDELSLARARQAFRDIEFHPTILRDVAEIDTGREVLGGRIEPTFAYATEGVRSGCAPRDPVLALDVGHVLDRRGGGGEPEGPQLVSAVHVEGPRPVDGVGGARSGGGYDTLLVTVDVPVAGARLRDTRNGMSIPPTLTLRTVLDAVPARAGGSTY